MCGFVGFFGTSVRDGALVLQQMIQTLNQRGPDDQGVWYDQQAGVV
jgi:asparagine synthetase B (glutamine-hydrolysing)